MNPAIISLTCSSAHLGFFLSPPTQNFCFPPAGLRWQPPKINSRVVYTETNPTENCKLPSYLCHSFTPWRNLWLGLTMRAWTSTSTNQVAVQDTSSCLQWPLDIVILSRKGQKTWHKNRRMGIICLFFSHKLVLNSRLPFTLDIAHFIPINSDWIMNDLRLTKLTTSCIFSHFYGFFMYAIRLLFEE